MLSFSVFGNFLNAFLFLLVVDTTVLLSEGPSALVTGIRLTCVQHSTHAWHCYVQETRAITHRNNSSISNITYLKCQKKHHVLAPYEKERGDSGTWDETLTLASFRSAYFYLSLHTHNIANSYWVTRHTHIAKRKNC
jgi:hypothetical protein